MCWNTLSFAHSFSMPPRKKTKTKITDAEKQVVAVTSTRKALRGKRGSLQNFPSMPLDILFEVALVLAYPFSESSHTFLIDPPVSRTSRSLILVKNEQELQKVFDHSSDMWPPLEDCNGECRQPPGTYAILEWASVDQFAVLTSLSCASSKLSLTTRYISEIIFPQFRIVSKSMSEPSFGNLESGIVRHVGRSCMLSDLFLYCLLIDFASVRT